jgi:tripartite-type tricarboxylate transporter receptor subunit TctC
VVPFPPGGGSDVVARILAQKLGELWKTSVVVENVTGADGQIGTMKVVQSTPDGYALLIVSPSFSINKSLYPELPYDAVKDFTPVTLVATTPMVVCVGSGLGVRNMSELIALSRKSAGRLNYSASSSTTLVYGELLKASTGIDAMYIPYKGSGPSVVATAAGEVTYTIDTMNAIKPLMASGKLVPLAVAAPKRFFALPDTPTLAEAGFPNLYMVAYWGILGPAGMPPEIAEKLNEGFGEVARSPDVIEKLKGMGNEPTHTTRDEYGAFLKEEFAKYQGIVEAHKLRDRK